MKIFMEAHVYKKSTAFSLMNEYHIGDGMHLFDFSFISYYLTQIGYVIVINIIVTGIVKVSINLYITLAVYLDHHGLLKFLGDNSRMSKIQVQHCIMIFIY